MAEFFVGGQLLDKIEYGGAVSNSSDTDDERSVRHDWPFLFLVALSYPLRALRC